MIVPDLKESESLGCWKLLNINHTRDFKIKAFKNKVEECKSEAMKGSPDAEKCV